MPDPKSGILELFGFFRLNKSPKRQFLMLKNQDKMGNRKIPGITSLLNIVLRQVHRYNLPIYVLFIPKRMYENQSVWLKAYHHMHIFVNWNTRAQGSLLRCRFFLFTDALMSSLCLNNMYYKTQPLSNHAIMDKIIE